MNGKNRYVHKYKIFIGCFFGCLMILLLFFSMNYSFQQDVDLTMYRNSYFKDRTIMIYMIGSNLESRAALATMDVKEIEQSGISLDDNHVVIYAGGTKNWHNHFENNSIYELTDHGFELVSKDKNVSMGEADTLTYFLTYVQENYNSDNYGLIFWDHGAGPIKGYGYDEVHDGDRLQLTEMKEAFDRSGYSPSRKFEFVGFDTCLMASVEVAHILSDYSDYMIASQDLEPEYGWDYGFMSQIDSDVGVEGIGKLIIDYTDAFYQDSSNFDNPNRKFDVTLSMVDLTKMDNLELILNNLFLNVDASLLYNKYSDVVSQITQAHPFGYFGFESSYDLVDLYGVSEQLKDDYPEQALLLQETLKEIVVYQKSNVEGANGVSIYYPYYTKEYLSEYMGIYNQLGFADSYTKFLFHYSKLLLGTDLYDIGFNIQTLVPSYSDDTQFMQVTLDENVISHYNRASYVIMRKMNNRRYMPVYKSSDVVLQDDGVLLSNIQKKQLSVIDSQKKELWTNMFEYSKTDQSVTYLVPVTLYQFEDNGVDIHVTENAYIKFLVDSENPTGTIVNVVPMSHVDHSSSMKSKIDLREWDSIQFFNYEYEIYDPKDNLLIDWDVSYNTEVLQVKSDEGYKLEFTELDQETDYYGVFEIEDTHGNVYYTNLVKLN